MIIAIAHESRHDCMSEALAESGAIDCKRCLECRYTTVQASFPFDPAFQLFTLLAIHTYTQIYEVVISERQHTVDLSSL
jgi:hypothetical protein